MEPYGYSIFCEDIREEKDGKRTLVGVFQDGLFVQQFPIIIPKLAIITNLVLSSGVKIQNFDWSIYFPGDDGAKPSFIAKTEAEAPFEEPQGVDTPNEWRDDEVIKIQRLTQSVVFSPVQLLKPGLIKVRAVVGDNLIKAGVLRVGQVVEAPTEGNEATWTSHKAA